MTDDERAGERSGGGDKASEPTDTPRAVLSKQIGSATEVEELKRLITVREFIDGKSPADIKTEFGWSAEKVTEWLNQFDESYTSSAINDHETWTTRLSLDAIDPRSILKNMVVVFLVFLLLLWFLNPGLLVALRSSTTEHYGEIMFASPTTTHNEQLRMEMKDIEYLNRIFREKDTEVGYCGLLNSDGVIKPWLAETQGASRSAIVVLGGNCPTYQYERIALIHTHPNGDPRLSDEDRSSLVSADYSYQCIQHGLITATVGEATDRLRCYTSNSAPPGSDTITRVPVKVTESPG